MTRTSLPTIILVGIKDAMRPMCGIQIGTAKQLSLHVEYGLNIMPCNGPPTITLIASY